MQPHELWSAVRRFWAVSAVILVACLGVFGYSATSKATEYHSSVTLSVQPPASAAASANTADFSAPAVQFLVPVIQQRVTSSELADQVRAALKFGGAKDFTVSASVTPDSGLIDVTVKSQNKGLILPVLDGYTERLTTYPALAKLPIAVNILQPPQLPIADSKSSAAIVAALEGLVIGVLLALAASLLLVRFSGKRDPFLQVQERLGIPVLGTLPRFDRGGVREAPEFVPVAARVRSMLVARRLHSVAIVSPGRRTGRSLIAAQTAKLLAVTGLRVILVDADLRNPGAEAVLRDELAPGSELVPGVSAGVELPVAATTVPQLYYLGGGSLRESTGANGPHTDAPATTVAGAVRSIARTAATGSLVVVVDTPPSDEAPEADLIMSGVGGVVLVLDARSWRRNLKQLEQTVGRIQELDGTVLGVVINWSRSRRVVRHTPVPATRRHAAPSQTVVSYEQVPAAAGVATMEIGSAPAAIGWWDE